MQTLRRKATENISIAPMVPTRLVDESRCTSHSSSASIQYFTSATTPNDIARSKINSPSERHAVLARASASEEPLGVRRHTRCVGSHPSHLDLYERALGRQALAADEAAGGETESTS
eukprot:scaffold49477_cov65-Phaeocystis_antarctica.AAC.1